MPSDVYGAEHLLRLFGASERARMAGGDLASTARRWVGRTRTVKLPTLMAYTQMEESQVTQLQKHIAEFLKCALARMHALAPLA